MKTIIKTGIFLGLALAIQPSYAADPFAIYPFKVPEEYNQALKGYRTDWVRLTGFEYSGLHWQQFIAIYINKDDDIYTSNFKKYMSYYQDLEDSEDEDEELAVPKFKFYSPGTIILKENFAANNGSPDTPLSITMMIKREAGYDKKSGDWEYVQFDASGQVMLAGNSQDPVVQKVCANCHINIAERDYIFTNFYSTSRDRIE